MKETLLIAILVRSLPTCKKFAIYTILFLLQVLLHRKSKGETNMKRFFMAVVLTVALSGAALAGDVPSTDSPAPPPPNPIVSIILIIISAVS